MATLTCNICNKRYSDKAPSCPHCLKNKKKVRGTNRTLYVIVALLCVIVVLGIMNYRATKENSLANQIKLATEHLGKNADEYRQKSIVAYNKTAESEAKNFGMQLELYYTKHMKYPADLTSLPGWRDKSPLVDIVLSTNKAGQSYELTSTHINGTVIYRGSSENPDLIAAAK